MTILGRLLALLTRPPKPPKQPRLCMCDRCIQVRERAKLRDDITNPVIRHDGGKSGGGNPYGN